ncbi:hypothetical protein O9993_02590 [Vibrio lentus]|nr:hypothetical protein [Vibrio lentus]
MNSLLFAYLMNSRKMFVYGDRKKPMQLQMKNKDAPRVQDQAYEESSRPLIMLGEKRQLPT